MRYFFANIKAQGASGFEANLQQSLASKAKFLVFICTIPNPPRSSGRNIIFFNTSIVNASFFLFFFFPMIFVSVILCQFFFSLFFFFFIFSGFFPFLYSHSPFFSSSFGLFSLKKKMCPIVKLKNVLLLFYLIGI